MYYRENILLIVKTEDGKMQKKLLPLSFDWKLITYSNFISLICKMMFMNHGLILLEAATTRVEFLSGSSRYFDANKKLTPLQ